jgi:hypothetical protein
MSKDYRVQRSRDLGDSKNGGVLINERSDNVFALPLIRS